VQLLEFMKKYGNSIKSAGVLSLCRKLIIERTNSEIHSFVIDNVGESFSHDSILKQKRRINNDFIEPEDEDYSKNMTTLSNPYIPTLSSQRSAAAEIETLKFKTEEGEKDRLYEKIEEKDKQIEELRGELAKLRLSNTIANKIIDSPLRPFTRTDNKSRVTISTPDEGHRPSFDTSKISSPGQNCLNLSEFSVSGLGLEKSIISFNPSPKQYGGMYTTGTTSIDLMTNTSLKNLIESPKSLRILKDLHKDSINIPQLEEDKEEDSSTNFITKQIALGFSIQETDKESLKTATTMNSSFTKDIDESSNSSQRERTKVLPRSTNNFNNKFIKNFIH